MIYTTLNRVAFGKLQSGGNCNLDLSIDFVLIRMIQNWRIVWYGFPGLSCRARGVQSLLLFYTCPQCGNGYLYYSMVCNSEFNALDWSTAVRIYTNFAFNKKPVRVNSYRQQINPQKEMLDIFNCCHFPWNIFFYLLCSLFHKLSVASDTTFHCLSDMTYTTTCS